MSNKTKRNAPAGRGIPDGAIEFSAGPDLCREVMLPKEEVARLLVRAKVFRGLPDGAALMRFTFTGIRAEFIVRKRGREITVGMKSDFQRLGLGRLVEQLELRGLQETWSHQSLTEG